MNFTELIEHRFDRFERFSLTNRLINVIQCCKFSYPRVFRAQVPPNSEVDTAMKELEEGSLAIESEMRGLARSGSCDSTFLATELFAYLVSCIHVVSLPLFLLCRREVSTKLRSPCPGGEREARGSLDEERERAFVPY